MPFSTYLNKNHFWFQFAPSFCISFPIYDPKPLYMGSNRKFETKIVRLLDYIPNLIYFLKNVSGQVNKNPRDFWVASLYIIENVTHEKTYISRDIRLHKLSREPPTKMYVYYGANCSNHVCSYCNIICYYVNDML